MANGYSTGMMGIGINDPVLIPQGVINVIRVDENTPNLQEIQSFPVTSINGNIHIHQDPVTGQMYEMTDEFHSMIPQILAGFSSAIVGGVISRPSEGTKKSEKIPKSILEMSSSPNYIFAKISNLKFENKSYIDLSDYAGVNIDDSMISNISNIIQSDATDLINYSDNNQNINLQFSENFNTLPSLSLLSSKVSFTYPSPKQTFNSSNTNSTSRFVSDVKFVYPRPR